MEHIETARKALDQLEGADIDAHETDSALDEAIVATNATFTEMMATGTNRRNRALIMALSASLSGMKDALGWGDADAFEEHRVTAAHIAEGLVMQAQAA